MAEALSEGLAEMSLLLCFPDLMIIWSLEVILEP